MAEEVVATDRDDRVARRDRAHEGLARAVGAAVMTDLEDVGVQIDTRCE